MLSEYVARTARVTTGALVLLCLGVFLVLLALSWFMHPLFADDYCYATRFMSLGVVGGLASHYMEWTGGFSSTALSGTIPVLFVSMMHRLVEGFY